MASDAPVAPVDAAQEASAPEQILLPPLAFASTGDVEMAPERRILQGLPPLFTDLEEMSGPPGERENAWLSSLSCGCSFCVVSALLGTVTCLVMLILNEASPLSCPSHHVECSKIDQAPNPHWRTGLLLAFLACCVALPWSIASCQSNCICLLIFLREDGFWRRLHQRLRAVALRCAALPRHMACRCRWRPKSRVQPENARTSSELQRCFGLHEGFDFILPPPLPRKQGAFPDFPPRWLHSTLESFHEVVELHGEEAAEVARHVRGDATWHRPPRCERVLRLESSAAWRRYAARRRGLGGEAQERLLLFGTTVEVAEEVQRTAEVPDTPDCPRHVLLRRFGGGSQFCDQGFLAHEQALEAGYNKEGLDSPWAVLLCHVVLGRSLVHKGQHAGPGLQRDWGSGQYSSITLQLDRREFLLPPDVRHGAYPEYVAIFR